MCGIAGVIGMQVSSDTTDSMLSSLRHRGPDGSNSWRSSNSEKPAWFGHTRLSVLDLDARSNQPMVSDCGRWVLVYNGEIYNFLELRQEMVDCGIQFNSESDTEVLLKGLVTYGADFQHKCNGMWAFCLFDRSDYSILVGRDRFGKKPLYYMMMDGGFAFASEMKGLYPLLESVEPSPDFEILLKNSFEYEYTDKCVVKGLVRLKAGYNLRWKLSNVEVERWWCTLDHLETPPSEYSEQVERFRELFLDAVRIRMRADVRIGTALSGGLDSSSVICAMSYIKKHEHIGERSSNDWQHAVCSVCTDAEQCEIDQARIVTNYIGIPLQTSVMPSDFTIKDILRALWQTEDPYMTLPLPHLATYKAMSDAGIKVSIDGHGADELFCGYVSMRKAFKNASMKQISEILSIESALTGPPRVFSQMRATIEFCKEMAKNIFRRPFNMLRGRRQLVFEDMKHPNFSKLDNLSRELYELFHITSLPTLLRNYDRYSMASGVEIRMPFLDHRLVCYIFSLPWTSKIGAGFTKRLLRDAMIGILPEEIRKNKIKIGWNAPMVEWLNGPLKEELQLIMKSGSIDLRSLKMIERIQNTSMVTFVAATRIWNKILLPELWKRSLRIKMANDEKSIV